MNKVDDDMAGISGTGSPFPIDHGVEPGDAKAAALMFQQGQ